MELQEHHAAFVEAGVGLVAISYDATRILREAAQERGIAFPLLSDPESRTIDAWGVRNEEATGRTRGIPHPTVFVVDREGVIRRKLRHEGYKERPPAAEILDAAKALE